MFVAQAHSFAQQARLAITLAWVAGYTNILSILVCKHVISHASGTTSDFGRALAEGDWPVAGFLLYLLVTFCAGAMLSGFQMEVGRRRAWESIYVLPMATEALLLAVFAIALMRRNIGVAFGFNLYLLTGVASAAMGLQNATITRISGGVVRTTHVTGVLTDLGTELAQFAMFLFDRRRAKRRGHEILTELRVHPTGQRLALLASIVGSFALGAGLGTLAYEVRPGLAHFAMFPPVVFLLWIIFQDIRRPIAEIEPSNLVTESGLGPPGDMLVYHLRRDSQRKGAVHRMPNLLAWSERLPERTKVVVFDLGHVTELDSNAAMEVTTLLSRLRQKRKHLVIAGMDPTDFKRLSRASGSQINPLDVCPDVELALARGLNILHDLHAHA